MLVKPTGRVSVTETELAASGPSFRGTRVNVAAALPIIGEGDADFVMRRSAPAVTVTDAVLVLLLGLPSGTPADSVAEFVMVPLIELCSWPTIDTELLAPFANTPARLQVTVLPAAEQLQPDPEKET